MSKIYKVDIRGLSGTLLKKDTYSTFDDCLSRPSLRISGPQSLRTLMIHKYIPLHYLLVLLKEKMLILQPVSSWDDPYENFFLKQHFVKPGYSDPYTTAENLTQGLYGMSWSLQEETDSMWRIYSPQRMSIRITTRVDALVESICGEDDHWDVWANKVRYMSDDEMRDWLEQCKTVRDRVQFIEKMSESFFIKRKAFEAEQEFRIVVNYAQKIRPFVFFFCEPNKLISSYVVDPRVNGYEYDAIKASLVSFGVDDSKIEKSTLYDFQPQKVEMEYNPFQDF